MEGVKAYVQNCRPYLLMIFLQFGAAGTYIVIMATLNQGQNRYVLIVYRNAIAALVLAPFALFFERKKRPKMTLSIFWNIIVLGFLEPILDQGFGYLGMNMTSATYTSAIMNVLPAMTFIIAWILRMEKVKIAELRSQAKVIGTFVALVGTLVITLYKGSLIPLPWSNPNIDQQHENTKSLQDHNHWIVGTLLILLACVAWSSFYVLQSITIKKYPADLSLATLICLSGAIQSTAIALVVEHRSSGWAVGWDARLFAPLYTGIVSSGLTYYVQGMVMKTRGPVFVTAFNPLCMVLVAPLASFILQEQIHFGCVLGGVLIAAGLYLVVWGKGKDYVISVLPIAETNCLHELSIRKQDDDNNKLVSSTTDGRIPVGEHCHISGI